MLSKMRWKESYISPSGKKMTPPSFFFEVSFVRFHKHLIHIKNIHLSWSFASAKIPVVQWSKIKWKHGPTISKIENNIYLARKGKWNIIQLFVNNQGVRLLLSQVWLKRKSQLVSGRQEVVMYRIENSAQLKNDIFSRTLHGWADEEPEVTWK